MHFIIVLKVQLIQIVDSQSTEINWGKIYLLVSFSYASGKCPEIAMLVSRLVQTEI